MIDFLIFAMAVVILGPIAFFALIIGGLLVLITLAAGLKAASTLVLSIAEMWRNWR